ncbi:hypothetical protein [Nocardia sp. NPDC020380]|uniref:hypothetical protein n=1 Tax=Nocardia sp. NPDC020380 TaxID=3364309 RepID=UPI003787E8E6
MLRIWHVFGLQPWRTETFKISPGPLLIDKIRDVVGLYLAPPANAAVFSVDEKPQIQALQRTVPVLPMLPGVPERRSFDYIRHGTVDLFAALNTATGTVIGKLSSRHRAVDFRDFLDDIDRATDPALTVKQHRPVREGDPDRPTPSDADCGPHCMYVTAAKVHDYGEELELDRSGCPKGLSGN